MLKNRPVDPVPVIIRVFHENMFFQKNNKRNPPIPTDPPKITILGETKSDKIVTRIITKFGDPFITSILTNSGNSPTCSPECVTIMPKIP